MFVIIVFLVIVYLRIFKMLLQNTFLGKNRYLRVQNKKVISNRTQIVFGINLNAGARSSSASVENRHDSYVLASYFINSYLLANQLY